MGMGPQKQTTTSNNTTTSAPPSWAMPHLEAITNQAGTIYNNSRGYTGAFSPLTQRGIDMATGIANRGNPLGNSAYTNASNLSQMGGLNPAMYGIMGNLGTEYNLAGQPSAAATNLSDYASGKNLTGNPYLDKILATTNEGIANRVNGLFGGAGRSFSPAHAAALAKNIGAAENQARYADYDRQVQNQFQANQMLDQTNNARQQMRLGILGQQFSGQQQGINNMLGIGQNASVFDNARYLDANMLRGLGQTIDANEAMKASIPWQNLQNYQNIVRGASQGYGTQTSNGTQNTEAPGQSGWQTALGLGMTGLGLISPGFGGAAALAGGALGIPSWLNSGTWGQNNPGAFGSAFYGPPR